MGPLVGAAARVAAAELPSAVSTLEKKVPTAMSKAKAWFARATGKAIEKVDLAAVKPAEIGLAVTGMVKNGVPARLLFEAMPLLTKQEYRHIREYFLQLEESLMANADAVAPGILPTNSQETLDRAVEIRALRTRIERLMRCFRVTSTQELKDVLVDLRAVQLDDIEAYEITYGTVRGL